MKDRFNEFVCWLLVKLWVYIPSDKDDSVMAVIINPLYWIFIVMEFLVVLSVQVFKEVLNFCIDILEDDIKSFSFKKLWKR